ncbi:MAG TPA: hypothetical protein VFG69_10475, partial [Nannocystaceae bacterium]|nr:hypothetical protein [Nannocystaceae bacterium]
VASSSSSSSPNGATTSRRWRTDTAVSRRTIEEEMACGFGVCLGCAVPVYGETPYRYCCSDGPVFDARQVRWP